MVQTCFICKWRANREPKRSFHKFPSEESERNKWLCVIGKSDLNVGKRVSVCSIHFEDSCFRYGTVYGTKILKLKSVPTLYLTKNEEENIEVDKNVKDKNHTSNDTDWNLVVDQVKKMDQSYSSSDVVSSSLPETKFLSLQWTTDENVSCVVETDINEELESPASTQVCRICLACDARMYHIGDYKLSQYFQQITGILLNPDDRLPKMLCWECVGRLTSANRLRDKALRSHSLLSSRVNTKTYMSMRDVKSINRIRNRLQSTLTAKYMNNDDSDLSVHVLETAKSESGSEAGGEGWASDEGVPEVVLQVALEGLAPGGGAQGRPRVKHKSEGTPITKCSTLRGQSSTVPPPPARSPPPRNTKDGRYVKKVVDSRSLASGLDETLFTVRALSQAEQVAEVRRRRESHSYKHARYKCTVCYKHFHTQASYDEHAVKHSDNNGSLECPICMIRLRNPRTLRKHLTARHSRSYECNECAFSTRDRSVAKRHEMFHTGVKYQCPHCAKQFDKQTTYMSHVRIKHPSRFVCELCGFAFINQRGVDVHKFKKHKLQKNTALTGPHCGECGVRFVSEEAYSRHLKLSARHRRPDDPEPLTNDPQIEEKKGEKRLTQQVGGEPICCEQCGTRCADYRAYAQHFMRVHPGSNRTQYPPRAACMCDQCGKIFQSSVQLKGHMWVHTGDKPFKCSLCDKTFSNRPALQLHSRSHSDARPAFPCPVCGKSFGFYSNRRRHMLIHTGLKPFKCDTCGKCFMTVAERRSHVDHVHLKVPWPKRTRPQRVQAWR